MSHQDLPDAIRNHACGILPHRVIDERLPAHHEANLLRQIALEAPIDVTGARDTPEAALANLLTALETLGLITDSTTAS